jgi:hypothetical protein
LNRASLRTCLAASQIDVLASERARKGFLLMAPPQRNDVTGLRLSEDEASDVLLVRAIEAEDPQGTVFTREDRQFAETTSLQSVCYDGEADQRKTGEFLACRARLALERLAARYPQLQRARSAGRWPPWLNLALPGAALLIGLLSNQIEGDRLNILAFPLLGMLAWNVAVYILLIVRAARRALRSSSAANRLPPWVQRLLSPAAARLAGHPTLERALSRFGRDWVSAAAPVTLARVRRSFHLSAATFAIGIVTGLLVRARYTAEYAAGWSGTWAGAEWEVAALLQIVLGPASALTGIGLPSAERLQELRGSAENAGDWLILWVVTAALVVIVPRLCLAGWEAGRSLVLGKRIAIPDDFYVRSLLRNALGRSFSVRVVPYGVELDGKAQARLASLVRQVLGDKSEVQVDRTVPYGEEDNWIAREGAAPGTADTLVLLFSLGSTPEAENHGAFAHGVQSLVGQKAGVIVLLEDSSFARKFSGQASAERRLQDRHDAWKAVLARTCLKPIRVDLSPDGQLGAAHELEQALAGSPVPS